MVGTLKSETHATLKAGCTRPRGGGGATKFVVGSGYEVLSSSSTAAIARKAEKSKERKGKEKKRNAKAIDVFVREIQQRTDEIWRCRYVLMVKKQAVEAFLTLEIS